MHVILGHVRQVEIDHMRQLFDVESPRRDVGGHEDAQLAVLEALQRAHARILALVAVNRIGFDAIPVEVLGEPVGAALGLAEHEDLPPIAVLHEVRQQVFLAVLPD